MKFSESMEKLEHLCSRMEKEALPLEEALGLYKEGMELVKACRSYLEYAEQQVLLVDENMEVRPLDGPEAQEIFSGKEKTHEEV